MPLEGDGALLDVLDAALHPGDGGDVDLRSIHVAHHRHHRVDIILDADKAQPGGGDVVLVAVLGIGGDGNGVDLVVVQGVHGHAGAAQVGALVKDPVAVAVLDAHPVVLYRALGVPLEGDVVDVVGDVVDAVVPVGIGVHGDDRRADDGGLLILRRVAPEQQLLGAHGGHAVDGQSHLPLEQLHGLDGGIAVVAGDGAGEVAQLPQPPLQAADPVVFVATAQGDVAGGLRGTAAEQPALYRLGGVAVHLQTGGALEGPDGLGGGGGVGAARVVLQVVELL